MLQLLFIIIGAYILGSIPSSVWIGRACFKKDVRKYGSGNAGATNTFRVLGKKAAIPVLLIDILKGFFAIKLVYLVHLPELYVSNIVLIEIGLTVAALLGHLFPIFAQFKGGKGIATLFGAMIAIYWPAALGVCLVFVLLLLIFGYVSLASIAGGISLPCFVVLFSPFEHFYFLYFCLLITVIVFVTHRKNIGRLLKGEESKIFKKKQKNTNSQDNMI